MPSRDGSSGGGGRGEHVAGRLAKALACSPEVFSDLVSHDLHDTLELLNLWLAIRNPQDRAKALSILRTVVETTRVPEGCGAQPSSEAAAFAHARLAPVRHP